MLFTSSCWQMHFFQLHVETLRRARQIIFDGNFSCHGFSHANLSIASAPPFTRCDSYLQKLHTADRYAPRHTFGCTRYVGLGKREGRAVARVKSIHEYKEPRAEAQMHVQSRDNEACKTTRIYTSCTTSDNIRASERMQEACRSP